MKTITVSLIILWTLMAFSSCSKDDIPDYEILTDSEVVEEENSRVSVFSISQRHFSFEDMQGLSANLSSGIDSNFILPIEIRTDNDRYRCRMRLADGRQLPDAKYLLTFTDKEGASIPGSLMVYVESERVVKSEELRQSFSLRSGDGTKENPYVISSQRDFVMFLDDLRDPSNAGGRGLYFKQTADIKLPDQSSSEPGRGYFGFPFAGHYDGGRHVLTNMYYRGSANETDDSGIGIFPSLMDGAEVRNLTVSAANISGVSHDVGLLAGSSCGSVVIENLTIEGIVTSPDAGVNIGGVVGRQKDGYLRLKDIKLKASVYGRTNVGGLIGLGEGGSLTVENVSTPDSHFYIQGYENVGGVIGKSSESCLSLSNIQLTHEISDEDKDVHTIMNTGGEGTGGAVGHLYNPSEPPAFSGVVVRCPVGGEGNRVGGLVGKYEFSDHMLRLHDSGFMSVAKGGNDVGGLIGYMRNSGSSTTLGGDWAKNVYVGVDEAAAGVEGKNCVGGAFGYTDSGLYPSGGKGIRIVVNVKGTEDCVGGIVGKCDRPNFYSDHFEFPSSTMKVEGRDNVGGLIGLMSNGKLEGADRFNYQAQSDGNVWIPKPSERNPQYRGNVYGHSNVGGLVGKNDNSAVKYIAVACGVVGIADENNRMGEYVGGAIGKVESYRGETLIEDVTSASNVSASGVIGVGGVTGGAFGSSGKVRFQDCINYGHVQGGIDTGGVVGILESDNPGSIMSAKYCVNTGMVEGNVRVGGVVGQVYTNGYAIVYNHIYLEVIQCANFGKVSSSGSDSRMGTGGIIGYGENNINVEYCMNAGTVSASGEQHGVAGIAGALGLDPKSFYSNYKNVSLHKCVNRGDIESPHKKGNVAGILGIMEEGSDSNVDDCWNSGEIKHDHDSDNGGIVGYVDHLTNIYRCVNYGKVNYGNAAIGTHKSGSQFSHGALYYIDGTGKSWPSAKSVSESNRYKESSYDGLDFKNVWRMGDHGPELRDNYFQNATF